MKTRNPLMPFGFLFCLSAIWTTAATADIDLAILEEIESERTMECVLQAISPDEVMDTMLAARPEAIEEKWAKLEERLRQGHKDTSHYEESYNLPADDPMLVATRDIKKSELDLIKLDFKYNKIERERCGWLCLSDNGKRWNDDLSYEENLRAKDCKINPDWEKKSSGSYVCKFEQGIRRQKQSEAIYKSVPARIQGAHETIKALVNERKKNAHVIAQENANMARQQYQTWTQQCYGKLLLREQAEAVCEEASTSNPICRQRDEQGRLPKIINILSRQPLQFKVAENISALWEDEQEFSWVPFRAFERNGQLVNPPGTGASIRKGNLQIGAKLSFFIGKKDEIDAPLYDHISKMAAQADLPFERHGFIAWPMIEVGGFTSPFTTEDAYAVTLGQNFTLLQLLPQPGAPVQQRELLSPEALSHLKEGEQLHFHGWETLTEEMTEVWKLGLATEGQAKVVGALLDYQRGELFNQIKQFSEEGQ